MGMSYITNFPPDVYRAEAQNWAVVQDKRGVLFFGNNNGVLEYDGNAWNLIKTPSVVRSLAMDGAGKIYVGIRGDFGYLQADSVGIYQYQSLKERIPPEDQEFNDIWEIYVSTHGIFFQSNNKIFILQNEKLKVIYPKKSFHASFFANNTFYVRENGVGLMVYENDSLQVMKGAELFAKEKIYAILPYKQNDIFIATITQGIWLYNTQKKVFYKTTGFEAVEKFLLKYPVYCGTALKNGHLAIGTYTGGVIVFDQQGNIQAIYSNETGLQDNSIYRLYPDKHHQLWVCTNDGISLVQNNLPFQQFTIKNGLRGKPYCISYFDNRLYVGTSQYLCVQNPDGNFENITDTEGQNWQLFQTKGKLLLANTNGLFEMKGKKALPIITSTGFYHLYPMQNKPDYFLAGSIAGLSLLEYGKNTWKIKNTIKGFSKPAYKIVQDKEGMIWVYTSPGLYRLNLNPTMDSVISVVQYTTEQGLPSKTARLHQLNSGEIVFGTEKGIYRYVSANNTFEKHPNFDMIDGEVFTLAQQKNNDIWFQEKKGVGIHETGVLKYTKGNYELVKQAFYKFIDYPINGLDIFYVHADSMVFIGTVKGLLQYNSAKKIDYNIPYHTLIRTVFSKDSLLFGGAKRNSFEFGNIQGGIIPYHHNNLIFHYSAAFYEDATKNLYSYRLLGSDTAWSAWSADVKKEYTNLYEGEYTFEVRSQNQYKVMGSTASYSFSILPPWYRTWWAYFLYVLFVIGLGLLVVKIYTRRLLAKKAYLEQVVKERTTEIVQQKEEIQQSHKQITASINYAKRIQNAVLPNQELLKTLFPEHFIFLKPRDIVSGDFYFVKQIKNHTLIAGADCTGHGVPGAFMSMLGLAILNELVQKENIQNSAQVLNELRKQIKDSLQQTGKQDEQQDGMDIAFCAINNETLEMSFAGAYNPCWIFRKTDSGNNELSGSNYQLLVLEANRMPVGVYIKENDFTEQKFSLQENDIFYLFSDGYHSQFGGKGNEKYKSKRLKEFLHTICERPMAEQKELLEKDFNAWKGEQDQTDDVLVVGIRI